MERDTMDEKLPVIPYGDSFMEINGFYWMKTPADNWSAVLPSPYENDATGDGWVALVNTCTGCTPCWMWKASLDNQFIEGEGVYINELEAIRNFSDWYYGSRPIEKITEGYVVQRVEKKSWEK